MKKLLLNSPFLFFILFLCSLFLGCINSQNQAIQVSDDNIPFINPRGGDISNLEIGKFVKFPAVLVRRIGNSCVDLFDEDEFKKYNGDSKWAVTSRFGNEPGFLSFLFGSKTVMVTGKMTHIKDSKDTSKTCGIVTGEIFEIVETLELKND